MTTDVCDFPECENRIAHKCAACGQAFCPRHCQLKIRGTDTWTEGSYICDVCRTLQDRRKGIPVRKVVVIIVEELPSDILTRCLEIVESCGMKVIRNDSASGWIRAHMQRSFWEGCGEFITISVNPQKERKKHLVFIESRSDGSPQVVDFHGHVKQQLDLVLSELSKYFQFRYWPA